MQEDRKSTGSPEDTLPAEDGVSENTDTACDPDNADNSDNSGVSENADIACGTDNADNSDNGGVSENADTACGTDNADNSDNSGVSENADIACGTDNTDDTENGGVSENADTDEDEGRPPVDPRNKLYTVISLLIFAVGYFGYHYIADNFSLESAYFIESPAGDEAAAFAREIGWEYLPEGSEFLYARLHKNFDDNALYCAFLLPEAIEEPSDFEEYIPFDWAGPVEDERFTVYPEDNMIPDYVYGDSYVYRENPKIRCLIYKENDRYTAVFRTTDYGGGVRDIMRRGKIAR